MAHINWKSIVWGFMVLGVVPMVLLVCMHFLNFGFWGDSSNDGWLGFWGGYLGAILGLYGVQMQIKSEQKKSIEAKRPSFYIYYRTMLDPAQKVFVNFVQPTVQPNSLLGFSDEPESMKFESQYYYPNANFLSLMNSNKKKIFNISILVTSIVADYITLDKYDKSQFHLENKDDKKADKAGYRSFMNNTDNWSVVNEVIRVAKIENVSDEMLFVTYAQLFHYDNYIKKLSIIFSTDGNEVGLATFESDMNKNAPMSINGTSFSKHSF